MKGAPRAADGSGQHRGGLSQPAEEGRSMTKTITTTIPHGFNYQGRRGSIVKARAATDFDDPEYDHLGDELDDLDDAEFARPARTVDDLVSKLNILANRIDLPYDHKFMIGQLIGQVTAMSGTGDE
jgi:hypothetical protein